MKTSVSISATQKKLLRWYKQNKRSLAWRKTSNPYRILLSEVMLQQTQVSRVTLYYRKWLQKFPNFRSLATASTREVLMQWSGLGYNNRALRLQQAAKVVVQKYHSRLPKTIEELEKLPGIGKYTSHAIACFAFHQNVPVVDVNIQRIVERVFFRSKRIASDAAWKQAEKILPRNKACEWNQALMDFGSLVCTARNPKCGKCPIQKECRSAFLPALHRAVKKEKKEPSRHGIPRRLYRGKILKMLHDHFLTEKEIALQLWKLVSEEDRMWLKELLRKMIEDGLLKKIHSRYGIAE